MLVGQDNRCKHLVSDQDRRPRQGQHIPCQERRNVTMLIDKGIYEILAELPSREPLCNRNISDKVMKFNIITVHCGISYHLYSYCTRVLCWGVRQGFHQCHCQSCHNLPADALDGYPAGSCVRRPLIVRRIAWLQSCRGCRSSIADQTFHLLITYCRLYHSSASILSFSIFPQWHRRIQTLKCIVFPLRFG